MADSSGSSLPNLVLPGFPKCGTTSVTETLIGHPSVAGALPHRATHYFTPHLYDRDAVLAPVDKYARNYADSTDEKIRIDDTVVWVYGGEALANEIDDTLGGPKVLIMLREPAARTVSYLTWKKRNAQIESEVTLAEYLAECERLGHRTVDTEELNPWSGLHGSDYDRFLPAWSEKFGDRLRIGFMEDLRDQPLRFYRALAGWLHIDPTHFTEETVTIANKAAAVRSQRLERIIRAVGRRAQPLAHKAPSLYTRLRDIARETRRGFASQLPTIQKWLCCDIDSNLAYPFVALR